MIAICSRGQQSLGDVVRLKGDPAHRDGEVFRSFSNTNTNANTSVLLFK